MTAFDDAETSCPMCSKGLDVTDLCECDEDPMCWRDHTIYHVERGRWIEREDTIGDELMRRALEGWGRTA